MTQLLANPKTNKRLSKQLVWRALVIPAGWTLKKAVELLRSQREDCRFILVNGKYFIRADEEYEEEYNQPFMCLVPDSDLLAEWYKVRNRQGLT